MTAVVLTRHGLGVEQLLFVDPLAVQPPVGASRHRYGIAEGIEVGPEHEQVALLGGVEPAAVGDSHDRPIGLVGLEQLHRLGDEMGEVLRELGGGEGADTAGHTDPFVDEDHPGLALGIHVQGAVDGIPIGGGDLPARDLGEGPLGGIGLQNGTTVTAGLLILIGGEHVVRVVVLVDLGCPVVAAVQSGIAHRSHGADLRPSPAQISRGVLVADPARAVGVVDSVLYQDAGVAEIVDGGCDHGVLLFRALYVQIHGDHQGSLVCGKVLHQIFRAGVGRAVGGGGDEQVAALAACMGLDPHGVLPLGQPRLHLGDPIAALGVKYDLLGGILAHVQRSDPTAGIALDHGAEHLHSRHGLVVRVLVVDHAVGGSPLPCLDDLQQDRVGVLLLGGDLLGGDLLSGGFGGSLGDLLRCGGDLIGAGGGRIAPITGSEQQARAHQKQGNQPKGTGKKFHNVNLLGVK